MKNVILILGMGRSGTSLTSQIINKMGAYIGSDDDIMPANFANEDGYYENLKIVNLNDQLLHYYGGSWDMTEGISIDYNDVFVQKYTAELKTILHNMLSHSDYVAIKDPRINIITSLWQHIIDSFDVDVKYIYVMRNPYEVAESLFKRDGYSMEKGLSIWQFDNKKIQNFLSDKQFFKIYYTDLLNGKMDYKRLHDFVFGKMHKIDIDSIKYCVKENLHHNNSTELNKEQKYVYYWTTHLDKSLSFIKLKRSLKYILFNVYFN